MEHGARGARPHESATPLELSLDAVSRTIDFRKSQLGFLARGRAGAERARTEGDYVPANKAIAGLRKRLTHAQRAARK